MTDYLFSAFSRSEYLFKKVPVPHPPLQNQMVNYILRHFSTFKLTPPHLNGVYISLPHVALNYILVHFSRLKFESYTTPMYFITTRVAKLHVGAFFNVKL